LLIYKIIGTSDYCSAFVECMTLYLWSNNIPDTMNWRQ